MDDELYFLIDNQVNIDIDSHLAENPNHPMVHTINIYIDGIIILFLNYIYKILTNVVSSLHLAVFAKRLGPEFPALIGH